MESPEQRMDLYRRIALIENEEDADNMTDELIDRFGEPPKSVMTLINVALLRGEAAQAGIREITQKAGRLYFKLRFDYPGFHIFTAWHPYGHQGGGRHKPGHKPEA